MRCFMSPAPYDLGRCTSCIEREGGIAPCTKIRIGKALRIGAAYEVKKLADEANGRVALFL